MTQIINQDTEWASGSTHVLVDGVQIAAGATLKIDPGAVVNGGSIQVFGNLIIQGTPQQKVLLNDVKLGIVGDVASPATMSLDNAVLQGGSFLEPTGNAVYGSFSLTNSSFKNVGGYAYVWYPTGDDVISGNLFDGFGGFSVGTDGPKVSIGHNTFLNINPPFPGGSSPAGATITSWAAYNNAQVIVDHNNFLDVGNPTLALPRGYTTATLTATNNYFGTSDPGTIARMIFDKNDDLNSAGYISTASVLLSPDLSAPLPPVPPSSPDLVASSDSGNSNTDNITNIANPTFTGTGEEGNTVTLRDGSNVIGIGVVASGVWSIAATTTLSVGSNAIAATQTDAAGNTSAPSTALNVTLDRIPPNATAVTASPSDAILGAGALVNLALGFNEVVLIAGGTPALSLNNGGTATYVYGSGTNSLAFAYTVAAGQDISDLAVTAADLRGATVTDQAGNAALLTGAALNPAGVLAIEPRAVAGFDTTTNQPVPIVARSYTGPVANLQNEYINITSHNLSVATATPNWFVHSGSGDDAIAVSSGTNVLDGGTGSNFLTGGSGTDTFFIDDRGPLADIWSTVNNFHAGDAATIWGVTAQDFGLNWVDGQGAAGFTGLTLHATAAGRPTASLTLAGYTQADLSNDRISLLFGSDPASGSAYLYVHANS